MVSASMSWEAFIANGKHDPKSVSPLVRDSWKRCIERGLDCHNLQIRNVGKDELKKRRLQNNKLLRIAKGILENLYDTVKGHGFAIMLLDADCCVLEVLGDPDFLEENDLFRQGELWAEEYKGTNAMSLTQMTHKPQQIAAEQHFSSRNHRLTCSAAPVFEPSGHFLGVLDASGYAEETHAHTLGMVISVARAIEDGLRVEAANEHINENMRMLRAVMESIDEAVITVDKNGYITNINKMAFSILNKSWSDFRGKLAVNLLPNHQDMLDQVLKYSRYASKTETLQDKTVLTLNGYPIMNQRQTVCGGVITLRKKSRTSQGSISPAMIQPRISFESIIGGSEKLQNSLMIAKDVANSYASIYIEGESGTGKEMLAQSIHNASPFASGPFVAISCASIPQTLIESELFGYEDGTFSGGKKGGKAGKFELANNGTLFLDEIADMPLDAQVSLLRVLQEKQVVRIGGYHPIPINIRILSATNKCLEDEVAKGNFRSDLYYRLNVIKIKLPPLREREDDILILARHFQQTFCSMLDFKVQPLSDSICGILCEYPWPGNVRELSNAMERAVNLAKGGEIKLEHLPESVVAGKPNGRNLNVRGSKAMDAFEKQLLEDTLRSMNGNITKCASHLGISRNTLYRKIEKYDLKEYKRI